MWYRCHGAGRIWRDVRFSSPLIANGIDNTKNAIVRVEDDIVKAVSFVGYVIHSNYKIQLHVYILRFYLLGVIA